MQARLTTKPEQDVIAAIQELDLESIKLRVMDGELGEGWSREYADSIEAAYKTYLTMLVKYPDDAEDILLNKDVDEFWHLHILHTIKYAEDCQRVFGSFLHHTPRMRELTPEERERTSALHEKTRRLYQQEFDNARAAAATRSGAAVAVENAAYCGASSTRTRAAYCGAAIRAENTAYCGASIRETEPAYCGAVISARNAAYCGASVSTEGAAYCGAAIRTDKSAYCGASVGAADAAYCGAVIRPGTPSHCAQPGSSAGN